MSTDHDESTCNDDACPICTAEHDSKCSDPECSGECLDGIDDEDDEDDGDDEDVGQPVDHAAPIAVPALVNVAPIPGDPFSPPAESVAVSIKRRRADGSTERCEAHDPTSRVWRHLHPAPITAEEVLTLWGSGSYVLHYFNAAGRLTGRRPEATLDDPEHPPRPARARFEPPAPPAPKPVAPPPPRRPRPAPAEPADPPVPPGATAPDMFALLRWAKREAQEDFDRRIALLERESSAIETRAAERHRRDMEEIEMRHKRAMEVQAAMTRDLLATAVQRAEARAPLGELSSRLEQIEDALAAREEPEKSSGLEQMIAAALPAVLERLSQPAKPQPGGSNQ